MTNLMRGERAPLPPVEPPPVGTVDRATLLDFEARWWRTAVLPGAKEEAIRAELRVTPTRYYQLLNWALNEDLEACLVEHPVLVHRLLRIRDARRVARERRAHNRAVLRGAAS